MSDIAPDAKKGLEPHELKPEKGGTTSEWTETETSSPEDRQGSPKAVAKKKKGVGFSSSSTSDSVGGGKKV